MKHEIPWILKQGGAIVNTSSGTGVKGFAGQAAYAASKFFYFLRVKCCTPWAKKLFSYDTTSGYRKFCFSAYDIIDR